MIIVSQQPALIWWLINKPKWITVIGFYNVYTNLLINLFKDLLNDLVISLFIEILTIKLEIITLLGLQINIQ